MNNQEKLTDLFESVSEDVLYDENQFESDIKKILQDFAESFAQKVINEYQETKSCSLISDSFYKMWLKNY